MKTDIFKKHGIQFELYNDDQHKDDKNWIRS